MSTRSTDTFTRLLADENLTIVRVADSTASFDLRTRVLRLPLYAIDMPESVTDMFAAHEVSHALFTPGVAEFNAAKELLNPDNPFDSRLHNLINIVEDARIEKLIKRKYPGIRRAFAEGYAHLIETGKFDVSNVAALGFFDRMNVYAKVGGMMIVPFSDAERAAITRLNALESWEDVLSLVADLYNPEAGKSSKPEDSDADTETASTPGDDSDGADAEEAEDKESTGVASDESEESEEESTGAGEAGDESDEESEESADGGSGDDESDDDSDSESDDESTGAGEAGDESDEESEESEAASAKSGGLDDGGDITTADALDKAMEEASVTDMSVSNYTIDRRSNFDHCFESERGIKASRSRFLKNLKDHPYYADHVEEYAAFNGSLKPMVTAMVQSFKRNQAAIEYRKNRTAKTGVIDTNRLHQYKLSDDIFKRAAAVQKGKSHGMMFFVDNSSSMANCIHETAKTIMMLVKFCQGIRVPFEVYSFTTHGWSHNNNTYTVDVTGSGCRIINPKLVKLMSSDMRPSELAQAFEHFYAYTRQFNWGKWSCRNSGDKGIFAMKGTPITQTLEIANELIRKFKAERRVDIVTAIMLTDGEDSDGRLHHRGDGCFTHSTLTKKTYNNMPYANALIQDMRSAHGINFINMHVTNYFDLPMNACNETGEMLDREEVLKHREDFTDESIVEIRNRGGFDASYVMGFKSLGLKSRKFVQRLAENFASDSNVWK